jgi:N-hydroxyarylamine O-acetyltransferase
MTARDIDAYLDRIGFKESLSNTDRILSKLHEQHIISVPFENIDVALRRPFSLDLTSIFQKVVSNRRGGYCYELNHLFYHLLVDAGFQCKLISCKMFDSEGKPGPDLDHMAIIVETRRRWLVDVGAGDLFVRPIDIDIRGIQMDRQRAFTVEKEGGGYLLVLHKQNDRISKYSFTLERREVTDFEEMSVLKQLGEQSYFVKNLVCTRATPDGRITVFNHNLKRIHDGFLSEEPISSTSELDNALQELFNMNVTGVDKIDMTKFRNENL